MQCCVDLYVEHEIEKIKIQDKQKTTPPTQKSPEKRSSSVLDKVNKFESKPITQHSRTQATRGAAQPAKTQRGSLVKAKPEQNQINKRRNANLKPNP